jgi:uncharacterized protein (DUF1684 family)
MNSVKYLLIIAGLLAGCDRNPLPLPDPETYRSEIEAWHAKRLSNLKAPEGWLNLAGLYWLNEGLNSFGSDTSNTLVFPEKAPAFIGVLELKGDSVYLRETAVPVMVDSMPAANVRLKDDSFRDHDVMRLNSFAWFIIKRGDRYGIRLRDYDSPMIDSLTAIPCFETTDRWRIIAEFKPYAKPEKYMVQTVIGTEEENLVPGELTFRVHGKKLTLYPFDSADGLFIVFGDKTNGNETYPAGRFLYTAAPDDQNRVIIDFNKAYNPPCAFTPYATCPLPLPGNILPVAIEAGEKAVHLFSQNHN